MARRSSARPSAARRRGGSALPGWVWLLFGAAFTLFVVVVWHLAQPRHEGRPAVAEAPAATPPKTARIAPVPVPPEQKPRFSFYRMLPSREVVIPDTEAEKAVKADKRGRPLPAELAAPGDYVVQVGAYRSRDEAERARAGIALLGVEAHTEQVTLNAGDIWYRVRIGPEPSLDQAQAIMQRLTSNGVKAILIKQKS